MKIYNKCETESDYLIAMKIEVYQIIAITQAMEKASTKQTNDGFKQLISRQGRELRVSAYDFIFDTRWGMDELPYQIIRFNSYLEPLMALTKDHHFNNHFGYFVREIEKIISGLTNDVLSNWIDECE